MSGVYPLRESQRARISIVFPPPLSRYRTVVQIAAAHFSVPGVYPIRKYKQLGKVSLLKLRAAVNLHIAAYSNSRGTVPIIKTRKYAVADFEHVEPLPPPVEYRFRRNLPTLVSTPALAHTEYYHS